MAARTIPWMASPCAYQSRRNIVPQPSFLVGTTTTSSSHERSTTGETMSASDFDEDESTESQPVRSFFNGTMDVRAYEEDQPRVGRALVFETDYGRRYAFVSPSDWQTMTDRELTDFARRVPD